ncbi:MAG: transcriptional regulator [Candidatus Thermoplasmatota archaeon]|nr:transcriptional regulator [Candidatus Thermoplasmatota archaeon]MCL5962850.1 transcriptional regulator [Candidatus Thermoplasmatota archaeon]
MVEGLSSNAEKIYKILKDLGVTSEDKMSTAERVTTLAKLPKNMVMNALLELQNKGYVKRKVREKAAGYYLIK